MPTMSAAIANSTAYRERCQTLGLDASRISEEAFDLLQAFGDLLKDGLVERHGYDLGNLYSSRLQKLYEQDVETGVLPRETASRYLREDTSAMDRLAEMVTPETVQGRR